MGHFSEQEQMILLEKTPDTDKQRSFYKRLRKRVDKYIKEHPKAKHIEYILLLPDLFHLICKLFCDSRVATKDKVYLSVAIIYCVSPIDFIPDLLFGGIGDDVVLIIKTLSDLIKNVDHKIIREHWTGRENIIEVIENLAKLSSDILGKEKLSGKITTLIKALISR